MRGWTQDQGTRLVKMNTEFFRATGEDRYLYVKVYKAKRQEENRMYVGGYVKVNAWILKVCVLKLIIKSAGASLKVY